MGKLIKGTHHVCVKCRDGNMYQEVRRFYHELLGLDIIRETGEGDEAWMMLNTGDNIIEVFAKGMVADTTGAVHHIALATDYVDECIEVVRQAGYPVTMEPNDIVIEAERDIPCRIAFAIGAAGEEIEFFDER